MVLTSFNKPLDYHSTPSRLSLRRRGLCDTMATQCMQDDLRRNYVMNKQNGLVIRPFRKAHQTRDTDKELLHLRLYLLKIAALPDLSGLRHSQWERYIKHELRSLYDQ